MLENPANNAKLLVVEIYIDATQEMVNAHGGVVIQLQGVVHRCVLLPGHQKYPATHGQQQQAGKSDENHAFFLRVCTHNKTTFLIIIAQAMAKRKPFLQFFT